MKQDRQNQLDELLTNWEGSYKRGLLSLWILLLLSERRSYAYEMVPEIEALSQGSVSAEMGSMYRALGRFEEAGIITSDLEDSSEGPPRRYYTLTELGSDLLARFIARNILVFNDPEVQKRLKAVGS